MFKDIFIRLCSERNIAPTVVCKAIGLSNAAYSAWDNNSVPRQTTLKKLADYFNVSVDYLLGKEEAAPASPIDNNKKELFDHIDQMTDEQLEQLKSFAKFLIESKNK